MGESDKKVYSVNDVLRMVHEVVENGRDKTTDKTYSDWSLLCLEHDVIRKVLDENNESAGRNVHTNC